MVEVRRRGVGCLRIDVASARVEGLAPRSRWFSVSKWQALAVRQVARELRLAHLWSWGWAQRDERSNDPDKTYAACVWLWARDPGLCDAPGILGREFDADRRTGQLDMAAGTRCMYGTSALAGLLLVPFELAALTALVVRPIVRESTRVSPTAALAVESRIVGVRFGGSAAAYRSALAEAGGSLSVARAIIGDELRARDILARLAVPRPSAADVARFRTTYAPVLARRVVVSPTPSWLPGGIGVALATSAPEGVFRVGTGRRMLVRTAEGVFNVRAVDDSAALAALPYALARPAIIHALQSERRADAYSAWTIRMQKAAASRLVCERDRLPELGVISLSTYVPFLSLHEAEAARWASARRRP